MFSSRSFCTRMVPLALAAVLFLQIIVSVFPSPQAYAAGNYRPDADSTISVLQGWYNSSNGLFNTTGWWQSANALNAVIDYSARTNTTTYTGDIATTYNANNGYFLNDYYDDEGWWGLTWVNAYNLTQNTTYLNAAKSIFTDMTGGWDSTCNGGLWWSKDKAYKNAIPNELFLELATELHQLTPGDSGSGSYLDWAQREWNWFSSSGLINSSSLVNDGLTSSCQNNGETTWTYNQGVILGGLANLANITGNSSYLSSADSIANAAISALAQNGVLHETCEPSNCNNDQSQFKGVFIRNLYNLYQADHNQAYENFILSNSSSIWQNDRNSSNQIGLDWAGPFDSADASRQSSALDDLNAALTFDSSTSTTFSTGFESGNPQPTWTSTLDLSGPPAGGQANVGAICCGLSGPEAAVRQETAHSGSMALMYSGAAQGGSSDYAYMKLFDLSSQNVTVGSSTTLSYWIYPQSSSTNSLVSGGNSSCVAIDLIFSDNTNLRDSGALDQHGNRAHPTYQCGHLTLDSWNHVIVNLGSYVNGKTVVRIDLGYDQPGSSGGYRGYIDDLSIL